MPSRSSKCSEASCSRCQSPEVARRRRSTIETTPVDDARGAYTTMPTALTDVVQKAVLSVTPVKGTALSKNIIQLIVEDHNRGREMYRQYMSPDTNTKQKQLLAWHIIRESSVHAAKEEQVLYPAMRSFMGDLAPDDCLEAHDTLKHKLTLLTDMVITDPNYDAMVQDFMQSLLEHMSHEEEELLPQFMATEGVTAEYLMQLGRLFEDSKLISPSRPHPWAPNKPPLNVVVNAAVSPVDFIRDMVRFEAAPPL